MYVCVRQGGRGGALLAMGWEGGAWKDGGHGVSSDCWEVT